MAQPRHFDKGWIESLLDTYLREINQLPLLTADEEKQLARRIRNGDGDARDRMVRANLRFVVAIARGFQGKCLPIEDLIEEGNLGLLRAIETFDPNLNTRFSAYAGFWIRQTIRRAIAKTARTIRISAYLFDLLRQWNRVCLRLQATFGQLPTAEEVAQTMGLSTKMVGIFQRTIRASHMINPADQSQDRYALEKMVLDDRLVSPEAHLIDLERRHYLWKLIHQMEPRETIVLRMRFGLNDEPARSRKEIGDYLELTPERVRQIECEALRKLGRHLQRDGGNCH